MSATRTATTRELASFLARLRYEDVPDEVVWRTKELFLDWVGSALAGRDERPVRILERFAEQMGPSGGPSEDLVSRRRTSPLFAALVNGGASHVSNRTTCTTPPSSTREPWSSRPRSPRPSRRGRRGGSFLPPRSPATRPG